MGVTADLNASCYVAVQGLGEREFNDYTSCFAFWSTADVHDPDKTFADRDAPMLDKAIASSVVAQYIGGQLQTLTGHFQSLEPNQYAPCINSGVVQHFLLNKYLVLPIETINRSQLN